MEHFSLSLNISSTHRPSFTAAASFFLMKQWGAAGCRKQITTTPQTITQSIINPNASWVKHTHAIISLQQLCLRNRCVSAHVFTLLSQIKQITNMFYFSLSVCFTSSFTQFPLVSHQGSHRSNQTCDTIKGSVSGDQHGAVPYEVCVQLIRFFSPLSYRPGCCFSPVEHKHRGLSRPSSKKRRSGKYTC